MINLMLYLKIYSILLFVLPYMFKMGIGHFSKFAVLGLIRFIIPLSAWACKI